MSASFQSHRPLRLRFPEDRSATEAIARALRPTAAYALAAALVFAIPEWSVLGSFAQIDNQPPTITSYSLHPDTSGPTDVVALTATFSEPVVTSSISLALSTSANVVVPASTTYDEATWTASLSTLEPLSGGTYTVTVAGATDAGGNVQASPVVWSFTISDPEPVAQSDLASASADVATSATALAFLSSTNMTEVHTAVVAASDSDSDGHTEVTTRNTEALSALDPNEDATPVATQSVLPGDGGSSELAPGAGSPQTSASAGVSELNVASEPDVATVALASNTVSTPEIHSGQPATADPQPLGNASGSQQDVSREALAAEPAPRIVESLPPGAALPIIPSDPALTTMPTFSWLAVSDVNYYAVSIADAYQTSPELAWFTPAEAWCATGVGICTVAAPRALAPGLVSWKVLTWNSHGYGPWSATATLVISVPDSSTPAPQPIAPSGPIAIRAPTYTWQPASGAINWYQLSITDALGSVHDFWYTPATTCSTTPCGQSPEVLLPIGAAQWKVRAFSATGAGAWSGATGFEASDAPPGKATLIAPMAATATTPAFQWKAVLGVSYYVLRFVDRDNVTVDRWYRPTAAGCPLGTGVCSASPGALKPGPANWQVLTWNASGYGQWSDRHDFVVDVTDPLAPTATPTNPKGVIATTHPSYTWTAEAGVNTYRLSVRARDGQTVYFWYTPASAGCTASSTCSVTPNTGLPNGTTQEWQVQAWTTRGSGPWTAAESFTVSIAVPRPAPSPDQQLSAVRLVEYGWDVPQPDFVRATIADMEQRPFNGVVMRLPDGGGDVFRPEAWDADAVASQVPILRDIRWQTFDSNFLAMYATSSMDWYDDADWRVVLQHAAFMARAAREGRCKGLMFDLEPYGPSPWAYAAQRHASTQTFSEYEAVVRDRGRAFMRALQEEYPGLDLLTFHGYSFFLRANPAPDADTRAAILKDHAWGLLPAFLSGMLEEVHSEIQIIDGHEQSFYAERPEHFAKAASEVRDGAFPWVPSELRDAYARHVQGAQPLYLDWLFGYFTTSASSLGNGLSDDQRAQLAEHHAYYAMTHTDRYVWVYSEKMNWWTGDHLPPGAEDALTSAVTKFRSGEPLGFDVTSLFDGTP